MFQTDPVGVEFFSYVNLLFCANKLTYRCWSRGWNGLFLVCNHVTRRPCRSSIQYNLISKNLHENRVQFPEERNAFVHDRQHGCRDVTCNLTILCTFIYFLMAFCLLHSMGTTWSRLLWRLVEGFDRRGRNSNRRKFIYIYTNWVSYNNRSQRTRDVFKAPWPYVHRIDGEMSDWAWVGRGGGVKFLGGGSIKQG